VPEGLHHIGRLLVIMGAIIAAAGLLLMLGEKLPWLGRLPGDIVVRKKNFTFYFPLATSIVISIILTLIFWLAGRK